MKRSLLVGLLCAAGAAAASASTACADVVVVRVFNFGFNPTPGATGNADVTINVGDTVRWVWESGFHSTTSAAGQAESWGSGNRLPPFAFEHTFTTPGTYAYYCAVHGSDHGGGHVGGMAAHVIVLGNEPACSACSADFNGDDSVDDLDISAFFMALEMGDVCADVNGDDGIDDLDVSSFFMMFEAGC